MTLIELLTGYRDIVRKFGRGTGKVFLEGICREELWDDIIHSVSDKGEFIDADNRIMILEEQE